MLAHIFKYAQTISNMFLFSLTQILYSFNASIGDGSKAHCDETLQPASNLSLFFEDFNSAGTHSEAPLCPPAMMSHVISSPPNGAQRPWVLPLSPPLKPPTLHQEESLPLALRSLDVAGPR